MLDRNDYTEKSENLQALQPAAVTSQSLAWSED
jgi:hypothetical protein